MNLNDALDGFKYAIQFYIEQEEIENPPHREGMERMPACQWELVRLATCQFRKWRAIQEASVANQQCSVCEEDEAEIACLSCGDLFCEYDWIDHLHDAEELVVNE